MGHQTSRFCGSALGQVGCRNGAKERKHKMTLDDLVRQASNKENFAELRHYVEFCEQFLDFIGTRGAIQAEIVSRNETHYRFIQFKNAEFSISRPLNSNLFLHQARCESPSVEIPESAGLDQENGHASESRDCKQVHLHDAAVHRGFTGRVACGAVQYGAQNQWRFV
jgi:hypothetical protein